MIVRSLRTGRTGVVHSKDGLIGGKLPVHFEVDGCFNGKAVLYRVEDLEIIGYTD